jgi:predicted nuclease of predicted toxin-antitoxin system
MLFKVDENLHPDVAEALRQYGHDAMTVFEQGMRGHADDEIANVCREESRTLVTLDLDFADIRQYPPQDYPGIIVFRMSGQDRAAMLHYVNQFVSLLATTPLAGHLWIVDENRIRCRGAGAQPP